MENQMAKALNSGNTNPEFNEWNLKKKNCFFITVNCEIFEGENNEPKFDEASTELSNKYNNIKNYLLGLKYNYFLASIEKNEKGFDHIHIFIQFNTPHKLSINKMEGANIQIMKSSVNACINYIKKDGNILDELGNPNFITGAPTIKDILNSNDPNDILDRIDFRFYSCINKIKNNNNWRQGLFNTKKTIHFINYTKLNKTQTQYNNYIFTELDSKHHYKNLSTNTAIVYNENIFKILHKINKCHNNYYFADIKNILIIYNNINEYRQFIKKYNEHLIKNNIIECLIIKPIIDEDDDLN